jgi:hypothetical protein
MREFLRLDSKPWGGWVLRSSTSLVALALTAASPAFAANQGDPSPLRTVVERPQRWAQAPGSPSTGGACTGGDLRIIDGESASIANWPSFVRVEARLSNGKVAMCGGAVVGRQWVLTAGHCVEGHAPETFTITEGVDDVQQAGHTLRVDRVVLNDGFHHDSHDAPRNDIALLHLSSPAQAPNQRLIPKSLLDRAAQSGASVEVAGFGLTTPQTLTGGQQGSSSDHLEQVALPIVTRSECARVLASALHASPGDPAPVDETNLCAGDPSRGGRDSCNGDSGGPLIENMDGRQAQIGVVSWGAGCGQKATVGVYTSVGYFESWIRSFVTDADFGASAESAAPPPPPPPPPLAPEVAQPCNLPATPAVTTVRLEVAEGDKLPIGSAIHVRATPSVTGQLAIFNVDLQTCHTFQVFPNNVSRAAGIGAVVNAGQTLSIPSRDEFVLKVGAPAGVNRLYAVIVPTSVRIDDLATLGADMRALTNAPALLRQLRARARASSPDATKVEAVGVHDYEIVR